MKNVNELTYATCTLCIAKTHEGTQPFREMNDSIGKGLKSRVMSRVPYFGCTLIVVCTLLFKKYHEIRDLLESKLFQQNY